MVGGVIFQVVGAKRLDFLRLPRGELSGTNPAEVVSIVVDSTTKALPYQLFVGADSDSLVAVVAHPPSPQIPLGQELWQVLPERLLGTEDSERDARGDLSRP